MSLQIKKSKDRFASREYMKWLSEQPCALCGGNGSEGHHTISRKWADGSDATCIPLCRACHNSVHSHKITERDLAKVSVVFYQIKFLRERGIDFKYPFSQEDFESALHIRGLTNVPYSRRKNRK